MSRFFPHTPYAEDQPLGRTILTTHVALRAVTSGALVGGILAGTQRALLLRRSSPAAPPPPAFVPALLRSTGVGTAVATGLLGAALVARMWGREPIEWQDRSWRLLENKGQVEVDDWTVGGIVGGLAGSAVAMRRTAPLALGWRGVVGCAGTGSVVGMLGYLLWRYGVNGGKFPERKAMR